jgi:V8-like Glu-specific endopeptidase
LHDLDTEALRQKLARYDATDAESYGRGETAGADPYPGPAYVPYLSTDDSEVFGIPVVYDEQYCQGQRKALWGSRFIVNLAGGDALAESSEPYHSRAERYLIQSNGGGSRCSATKMDDRHILTAAHCIVDDHYNLKDEDEINACTFGNDACTSSSSSCAVPSGDAVECENVVEIVDNGEYGGSLDQPDDWAVMRLLGSVTGVRSFFLSRRKSSLLDFTAFIRGYPGGTPDHATNVCTSNNIAKAISTTENANGLDVSTQGGRQFSATGQVAGVNIDATNFFISVASGISGGGMYYCWTGDCDEGAAQTSIASVYTGLSVNGPRSADFRSEVLAVIED